ncbi:MAG: uncharacterized protein KVP18_000060 [Porospora cf. gigantea A]|uniref:uncharacterized protein n=1 Tax=Porospora cf. gigantea A TaxID=2853593 RepID=UPI003559BEEC|nr:MAG: hypothetical protein KVP18_000060 [Porospora cf. gigantea A]
MFLLGLLGVGALAQELPAMCLVFSRSLVNKPTWMSSITSHSSEKVPSVALVFQSFLCEDDDAIVGVTPVDDQAMFHTFCAPWAVLCVGGSGDLRSGERCEPSGVSIWSDNDSLNWDDVGVDDFGQNLGGLCQTSCGFETVPWFEELIPQDVLDEVSDVCGGGDITDKVTLELDGRRVKKTVTTVGTWAGNWLRELGRALPGGVDCVEALANDFDVDSRCSTEPDTSDSSTPAATDSAKSEQVYIPALIPVWGYKLPGFQPPSKTTTTTAEIPSVKI